MTDKRFIEQFEENVRLYPDKVILRDEHHSLTFRELDELSGRVYAYLKEKGIGREDFVMISLPRGVEVVAAMVGVWKAGAALVVCEDWEPENRKRFIYTNSNCKLNLSNNLWPTIVTSAPLFGKEDTKGQDAAYALYTSGSSGKPKGVIHEYGQLEFASQSVVANGKNVYHIEDRVAYPLPTSSTGGFIHAMSALRAGAYLYFLPYSLLQNLDKFTSFLNEEKFTITGLVPSMILNKKIQTPYIKFFLTGSETTSNIYWEGNAILNMYGQTETSMNPLNFVIDHPYINTPIGVPSCIEKVFLLDDNDIEVTELGIGELCIPIAYTRGYINLPEETAKAFRNGLYHTGDIARVNEDGNYVILGRKSDMIKINGNRIEPAEIEAAVKKVLKIDWAFAKGFVEPDRSYIAVYYTAPIDINYSRTREELLKILPTYMIPSYFVHIDEVPHLPNGKIDRQAFKAPEIEQYRAPYSAPENELEERLCAEMEKVLGTKDGIPLGRPDEKRIGVNDDFYLLGGDSLRTIELVTNLGIEDLTVTDIYAARTPRAIAERWMLKMIAE